MVQDQGVGKIPAHTGSLAGDWGYFAGDVAAPMSLLGKMLPAWVPLAVGAVLLAGAVGGYFEWRAHQRALGAALVEASDAKAVAAQAVADKAAATKLLITLQANLTKMQATTAAGTAKIDLEPVVPGSPAEADAAATIRCLLQKTDCK